MDQDFIEQIRQQADLISIISDYVPLKKRGKNYWGCCPFHHEKTPSFSVTPDKGFFYCFGCGAGGNVFSFLMKLENLSFPESVRLLAQKLNVPIPEKHKTEEERQREQNLARLLKAHELAAAFYHACLLKTRYGEQGRLYLKQRDLPDNIITDFQIGFAPPAWDKLAEALLNRKISAETLMNSGLVGQSKQGKKYYDRFRQRVMFPISNLRGQVIGFGGRILDDGQPKYLNSPETMLFNKRHNLYGLDKAYQAIRRLNQAIVVEGYFDALRAHAAGFQQVVASLGTAFTIQQAKLLLKFTQEIIFAYDSDAAGQQATLRALETVRLLGAKIKVLSIPDGKDPDEFILKHGPEAFQNLIDQAESLVEYRMRRALEQYDYSTLEGKVTVINQVLPSLLNCENAVELNSYVSHLADVLNVDESAIRLEMQKAAQLNKQDKNVKMGQPNHNAISLPQGQSAEEKAERTIIRLMLEDESLLPYIETRLRLEHFTSPVRQELYQKMLAQEAFHEHESLALNEELSRIWLLPIPNEQIVQVVEDCLKLIELAYYKRLYEVHRLKADELERMGDSRFLQELAESQRIKDEINKLYHT